MTNSTPKTGELGQNVTYISTKGFPKAAMVIGTPESVLDETACGGHSLPELAEDERHLLIFTFKGVSLRVNVRSQDVALATITDADFDATKGCWK